MPSCTTFISAPQNTARIVLIPRTGGRVAATLTLADGRKRKGRRLDGNLQFLVPAHASLTLSW